MVGDGPPKAQVSKKRRHDKDACLNNLKLNVNVRDSKRPSRQIQQQHHQQQLDQATYTKRSNRKLIQGSLENVSTNPWGDQSRAQEEPSSLRRSRSLAISRETIFESLDFQRASAANAQSRRSQLIPRAKLIDRSTAKESRYKGASVENLNSRSNQAVSKSRPSRKNHREEEIYAYASLDNINEKDNRDTEQTLYFKNKSTSNGLYRASYDDLQGLSLPNYYPDSKCDTDFTDNISVYENASCVSLDTNNNITVAPSIVSQTKYSSTGNISSNINWEISGPESIPYDENILLSAKKSYAEKKPKTIRGPTPYHENYTYNKRRNSVSQANYEKPSPELVQRNEEDINVSYFETNNKLESETAKVISIHEGVSDNYDNIENNPVYGKLLSTKKEPIKTLIEVPPAEVNSEEYKTIVAVESENTSEEDSKSTKSKQHSHNYLREFLETQKGSKKPLQNFIAKKLSNLSRKKEHQNLAENQFLSLPDISIGENLKKCEKIDRKLRKCEKTKNTTKENRFIVNIGRHFDITANASVPVDFEVKIAKVPKKNKKKPPRKDIANKTDTQLIEAVQNLKQTLSASSISLDDNFNYYRTPEIIENKEDFLDKDKDELEIEMENKEFKEKVDTMRNYWGKIAETECNNNINEDEVKCKVVDLQTKVEDVKKRFEPQQEPEEKPLNKVTLVKQLFEVKSPEKREKISPLIKENCSYFERNPKKNLFFDSENQLQSLNPNNIEIIDKNTEKHDTQKLSSQQKRILSKSNSTGYPEFDHVRYRVVKSDLFQKKIFANCDKESQFEGLMQYLQDYSFQELLIDNNIVIIEPIRSKIPYEPVKNNKKISTNVTPLLQNNKNEEDPNSLRKHFFYHPIRVNKEVNDDELPNPDTVRQVRQFFEGGLKRSQSNQEIEHSGKEKYSSNSKEDPDKDHCSATDSNSNPSNISDFGSQENLFEYDQTENCCEQQYVSEDILEKIRECGSTITYYGGRVVKQDNGQPILTKAIMREIRNNERRYHDCNCKKSGDNDPYDGVKFKLVKSNSCSSRVELVGTKNLAESKKKYFARYKKLLDEKNQRNEVNACIKEELNENDVIQNQTISEKNMINESIRQNSINHQPKIIAEEMKVKDNKLVQWGDVKKEKIYSSITYSDKPNQKNYYEFHNYDKINGKPNKPEMEFEPYEVA